MTTATTTEFEKAMVSAPEVIIVEDHRVSCDGGGGALGHPKTFYELGGDDYAVCGYCDRVFILKDSPKDPSRV